jgi:hypothetical protein
LDSFEDKGETDSEFSKKRAELVELECEFMPGKTFAPAKA